MPIYDKNVGLSGNIGKSSWRVFNIDIAMANSFWNPDENCTVVKFILADNATLVI